MKCYENKKGVTMKTVKRFGVSLEENLLKALDQLVKGHGFPNRSQAIRFLIRERQAESEWQTNKEVAGCITLVYDHHKRDLMSQSMEIQHSYQKLVLAVQHIHLDHHNCLETIALKGKASQLKEFADKLFGIKGMKHGKFSAIGTGKNV